MKLVLWMLKELNVLDMPSFYRLQETQKKLAEEIDIQPCEHISTLGTKFHVVAPEDLLALVGDNSCQVQISYLWCAGLGQPACPEIDAGVPGGHFIN